MKKTLSIALSFCLLLVSFSGVLLEIASATSTPLSYYENSENWISNTAQSVSAGTLNDQSRISNVTAPDGSAALRMYGNIIYSIKLDGISKNKDYVFTYKYYVPSTTTMANGTKCWQKFPGIYQSGGMIKSDNSSCTGRIFTVSDKKGDVDTWHTVTFTFNSANNDILYFATKGYYAGGYEVYLKDISLSEVETDYYESPSNWRFYKTGKIGDSTNGKTNSELTNSHGAFAESSISYPDNSGESLKVTAHGEAPSVALKDLVVGKTYNFSFRYYVPTETKTSSAGAWLPKAGIYKKEAASVGTNADITCNNNPLVGPISVGSAANGTAGDATWKLANLNFTVTEATGTDLYFAYRAWYGGGYIIYFDDFKLTECATDWKLFTNTSAIGDTGNAYAGSGTSWEHATISTDVDSGTPDTKAVKLTANGKAAAYKLSVTSNKKYSIKFKYYVPESANSGEFLSNAGVYVKGKTLGAANALTTFTVNTKGSWAEASAEFESGANTELYLAAKVNVGSPYIIYIDDITLTEKPTIPLSYYEDYENWRIYTQNSNIGVGGKTNEDFTNNHGVFLETDIYSPNNDENSLRIVTHGDAPAIALKDLAEDKIYTLSFSYYVPAITITSNAAKAWMDSVGIYKKDTASVGANGVITCNSPVAGGQSTKVGEVGASVAGTETWETYSINFAVTEQTGTELYFAFRGWYGGGYTLYIDDFEVTEVQKVDGWSTYTYGTQKFGTGGKIAAFSTISLTDEDDKDGDNKAYKLGADNYSQYPAYKLEGLKKDTYYNLTFYYKAAAPTELDMSGGLFSHMYVVKNGGANVEYSSDHLGAITRGGAYYNNKYGMLIRMDGSITKDISKTDWNKVTISFYSNNETMAYLAMRLTVQVPVYVDGIKLETSKTPFEKYDRVPAENWSSYTMYSSKFGTGGQLSGGTVEEVSEKNYSGVKDNGKSFRINADNYSQWAAKKVDGLVPDTYYKLTMYYWSASTGANGNMFSEVRLVKDGGQNHNYTPDNLGVATVSNAFYTNKHGLIVVTEDNSTALKKAQTGKWNKFELLFYSGEQTSAWLTMRPVASQQPLGEAVKYAMPVYVDGITFEEVSPSKFDLKDQKPNPGWGGIKDVYEIDFEDEDFYVHLLAEENRLKIEEAPKRDGKKTNAIHILPGEFNTATCLNFAAVTPNPGRDPVFTMKVEENRKYSFSYWLYVEEGQEPLASFNFYYDYCDPGTGNTYITHTGMSEFGKWVKFETFFFTEPGQTECSIMFNAQTTPRDMWVDDIVLRKISAGTVVSEPEKSYCDQFYNMLSGDTLKNIFAAKSGTYKFKLKKNVSYVLGVTAGSKQKSSSRMFLSFDGVNPMGKNGDSAPSPIITANGKMERFGINFDSGEEEYAYLVIENDDGKLQIKEPTLFLAFYTTSLTHKGFASDPTKEFVTHTGPLGSFGKVEDIEDTTLDSEIENFDDMQNGDVSQNTDNDQALDNLFGDQNSQDTETTDSPQTGSVPVLPAVILFITTLFACLVLLKSKRGGEKV